MAWTVCVDNAGVIGDPIPSAVPGPYSFRTRFEVGEFTFVAKLRDPVLISDLPYGDEMINRKINVYENGVLRWRGRPGPWDADFDEKTVTIRCRTSEYDMERRFLGWAERTSILENGGFEDWTAGAPDGWTLAGTATVSQVDAIAEGTYAARITASDGESYLWQQDLTGADIEYYPGLSAVLTAWGKVQSGTVPAGAVLAELIVDGAPGTYPVQWTAQEEMAVGTMFRVGLPLFVAAGVDWTAEGRLRSIDDQIDWDRVRVTFGDATTVAQNGGAGDDLSVLTENLTDAAQASPWSNLGLAKDCPATGIMVIPGVNLAGFDHSKHERLADCYRQLIEGYGVDIWIGNDDTLHLRRKRGERRDELATTIDADDPATLTALADNAAKGDPSLGNNIAIVVGESVLFAADEAGAVDLTVFGGLTYGKWEKVAAGTPPLGLALRAQQIVDSEKIAPAFPELVVKLDDGIVTVGDVIPLTWSYGWIQTEADYRVTEVTVDPRTRVQRCKVDADDGVPLDSEEGS